MSKVVGKVNSFTGVGYFSSVSVWRLVQVRIDSSQRTASPHTADSGSETAESVVRGRPAAVEKALALFHLTKPRIAAWLHVAALASFYLAGTRQLDFGALFGMLAASICQTAGVFALNHYLERHHDALMKRTAGRPLPAGALKPSEALVFGLAATALGTLLFFLLVNPLVGALAASVVVLYLAIYTPMKLWTPYHTAPGAVAGAMPTLIGAASATGEIQPIAWILFAVLFFWQYPHFLSIDMLYREDYARAGMRVLPVVDRTGRKTAAYIVTASLLMIAASITPFFLGLLGWASLAGALLLGALFMKASLRAVRERTRPAARALLIQTVLHLPLLFGTMVVETMVSRLLA